MQLSARPLKVLALGMLIAVMNVYVFAGSEAGNGKTLLGKLITTSNRPVIVNGGEAITGSVIVSGAELTTPAASGAIVELNSLGTVVVSPSSNVILTFDSKSVQANVLSGFASVATAEGVNGTVVGLPANGAPTSPVPAGGNNAKTWGIAGVAVGSAAFIWAIISWRRANDARDSAAAAQASAASLAAQLAALRTCLAGQTQSPVKLCTSF
ncbi:MAG TPA: hypothetical protein VE863_16305 [Pyrinomonadaceae bacterium]|jgi:hypothetical protein|nr:hypothetical protein [Pyrinomonadaceae bacterium]